MFLLAFLVLAALGAAAIYTFLPAPAKQDARDLARQVKRTVTGLVDRQDRDGAPPEGTATTPAAAPAPTPTPQNNVDIPEHARRLPPPPATPPPPPVADTASEQAIPPAPPPPFQLPTGPHLEPKGRVAQLWNGIVLQTQFTPVPSPKPARELAMLSGPVLQNRAMEVRLTMPQPHQSLPMLTQLNPELTRLMPSLPGLLAAGRISPYFKEVYTRKTNYQRENGSRLDLMLSNHNFYDTETIVELQAVGGGRRALFIQSEMDTLTDGSDGDRFPEVVGESPSFQPFTSYAWAKRTTRENPFLPKVRAQIAEAERAGNRSRLATLRTHATELRARSFLVGWIDPFIALPIFMIKDTGANAPRIGDIAVILHKGKAYPALVGDAGPNFKLGEASYLICQALNPGSTAMQRPVSDLKVSYLVFPGSGQRPFGPPDPANLRERATRLLRELDPATTTELHLWPLPPVPLGYEVALALTEVTVNQAQLWAHSTPFHPALTIVETTRLSTAGPALEQLALLQKATPKAQP